MRGCVYTQKAHQRCCVCSMCFGKATAGGVELHLAAWRQARGGPRGCKFRAHLLRTLLYAVHTNSTCCMLYLLCVVPACGELPSEWVDSTPLGNTRMGKRHL